MSCPAARPRFVAAGVGLASHPRIAHRLEVGTVLQEAAVLSFHHERAAVSAQYVDESFFLDHGVIPPDGPLRRTPGSHANDDGIGLKRVERHPVRRPILRGFRAQPRVAEPALPGHQRLCLRLTGEILRLDTHARCVVAVPRHPYRLAESCIALRIRRAQRAVFGNQLVIHKLPLLPVLHVPAREAHGRIGHHIGLTVSHHEECILHRQPFGQIRIAIQQIVRVAHAKERRYELQPELLRRRLHMGAVPEIALRHVMQAAELRVHQHHMRVACRATARKYLIRFLHVRIHQQVRAQVNPPLKLRLLCSCGTGVSQGQGDHGEQTVELHHVWFLKSRRR